MGANDLNGKYFQQTDYTIKSIGDNTYTLQVLGSTGDVTGVTITLDQAGGWTRSGL